jgi:ABC-type branched-subunit amino acid transport system substrate-binding protein
MKGLVKRGLAVASSVAMIAVLAACSSNSEPEPPVYVAPQGVTDTEIIFGTHQPLTGPASGGYSKISPATKAYFEYVNANGGVYGRKITYKIVDDTYNPATTQTVVRQLVQQDKVFAILNGLGTPTHTGVLDFLKESEIPDLFVASGATTWNQPSKYPGTFAVQPDYTTEGKIIGNYAKTNFAGKKVCFFGQDDDFGRDSLIGLEKGLGAKVTAAEKYVTSNTNVAPQMSALKDAGCEVVVTAAIPGFVTLAIGRSAGIGFTPQWFAGGVGGDYTTVSTPLGAAAKTLMEGFLTTGYLPSLQNADNPWIKLFQKINTDYNAGVPFDGNVLYGMNIGYLTVQALLAAGKNLTTEGLIKAIQDNGGKFKGPGIVPFGYSATSHAGYTGVRLSKVTAGVQDYFGPAYTTDAADGPVKEYTEAPSVPPTNGIPTA